MRLERVKCLSAGGFHTMAYTEWGEPDASRTVVCVHGLTRNASDFDVLAARISATGARVVCPDVVGRGASDWLIDPTGYCYPQYMADMAVLLARLNVSEVDWVGTSMGGVIGMMLAAKKGSPIRRLVINDIGPFIPKASLERIASYVGADRRFPDLAAAEAYFRKVHAAFGALSDAEWRQLTENSVRTADEGGFWLRYDPGIAAAFEPGKMEDVDLWPVWDRIACPTLLLRGENSDLLLADTAAQMATSGPKAEVMTVPGCGHAPALLSHSQTGMVVAFLARD